MIAADLNSRSRSIMRSPPGETLAGLRPLGRRRRQAGRESPVARVPAGRTRFSRDRARRPARVGSSARCRSTACCCSTRAATGAARSSCRRRSRGAATREPRRTISRTFAPTASSTTASSSAGSWRDRTRRGACSARATAGFARSTTCPRIRKDCARCSSPAGCLRSPRAPTTTIARPIRSCAARRGNTLPGIQATRRSRARSWSTCTRAKSRCRPAGG